MDDFAIIKQVKEGDVQAFAVLVEKYHKRLLSFIFRLVDDKDAAEDIGQEVFLSVYKSLNTFDASRGTPFSAWLFIAARNRCISELRSRREKQFLPIEDALEITTSEKSADVVLFEKERLDAIKDSLEQLPEQYRSSILQSLRGASLADIAEREGISIGTVKSRLFRAREMMKSLLKEFAGGASYERI